jgi:hypothetical protein
MTVSSSYSPVPSWVAVEAHPRREASNSPEKNTATRLKDLMVILRVIDRLSGLA